MIFARIKGPDGKPIDFQHGYWEVKAGAGPGQTIRSPAASVHFDRIAAIPGVRMAYHVDGPPDAAGLVSYEVEIAIPLSQIGLRGPIPSGTRIGFDASVGIANVAGDRRERAAHWGGLEEAAVVDRPGSLRLLPENWGTMVLLDH